LIVQRDDALMINSSSADMIQTDTLGISCRKDDRPGQDALA
jgi:hypothetical protein